MAERAIEFRLLGDASQLESVLGRSSASLKAFGGDVEKYANAQVAAGARQREELERVAAQYRVTAAAAVQGSNEQVVAVTKAKEAESQLAIQAKVAADATMTGAQRSVAALVAQRQELEANVAEYRAIAAAAAKGSDEQVAANKLAADSARQLALSYAEVGKAAKASGAASEESGFARGVSSKLTGVGGWMAGPGFIAGAVGGLVLDQTIKAALEAANSVNQLDQAIRNAHASVQALNPIMAEYADKAARLGFEDNDTRQAEAELVTAFGATKKALGDLSAAEDLARMKHETLAQSTQQLILLQEGNTKAAKQFGLAIPDLTKAQWDAKAVQDGLTVSQEKGKVLYDELLPRIKDQAQAYANSPSGKIAEFQAQIQQLEIRIGDGLLPVVDKYLTEIDAWLSKSGNQKRVTQDVEQVVHDLGQALHIAYSATEAVLDVVGPTVKALGGWQSVIEAIIALKFGGIILGWVGNIEKLIGADAAGGLLGAETAAGGLLAKLTALRGLGVISVELLLAEHFVSKYGLKNSLAAGLNPTITLGRGIAQDQTITLGGKEYPLGSGAAYQALIKAGWKPPQGVNELNVTAAQEIAAAHSLGGTASMPARGIPIGSGFGSGPGSSGKTKLLNFAKRALGAPYLWGGNGPGGFDCSGLVQWAFANGLDIQLPHSTYDQVNMGSQVAPSHARVGDIVFTNYGESGRAGPGHEGLIVGFTKDGQPIIESAPHTGSRVQAVTGYEAFTGGGRFTVRDLTKGGSGAGPPWGPSTAPVANSGDLASAHAKAYHIPVELENKIREAQAKFAKDASKSNLDTLVALLEQEDRLMKEHGGKLPALTEIVTAEKAYQAKLAAKLAADAKANIAAIEQGTIKPEQTLKMAEAAGASTQIILADQQELYDAYRSEEAKLKAKLKSTTGKAKSEYAAALAKIDQAISSVKDSMISSLQSLAQAAQQKLSSAASTVESDVISQFEKQTQDYINGPLASQYFQGTDPVTGKPRQTAAEAQLAAMQQQDQQQQLQDALEQAQQQLAADQAAAGTPGASVDKYNAQVLVDGVPVGGSNSKLSQDEQAVQAAQRAIDENNLATLATQQRQEADAAYATAVQQYTQTRSVQEEKLQTALDNWATGLTNGTTNLSDLNTIASTFGVQLGDLTDPNTGIGYDFGNLTDAATAAALALGNLADAAGGSFTGSTGGGGGGGGVAFQALASGGDILTDGLVYVHAGERVQPAQVVRGGGGVGGYTFELHVDGRKLASVQKSRLDRVVRIKY